MFEITDKVAEDIHADLREIERLQKLSNVDLVRECLQRNHTDCLVVDEMCNRLWPGWADEQL